MTCPNVHGKYAVPDKETGHARFPDGTTSHSTKQSKYDCQVAGYLPIPLPVMPSPQSSPASGRGSEREEQSLIPAGEGDKDSLREFHVKAVLRNAGFSLIEVLVTIVILLIGLLGLAGLQGRALNSQLESYQRSQALVLLKDMENRINANRKNATAYVTAAALGTGAACPAAGATVASADLNEWCNSLMGAAEVQSGVPPAGAIIGARGCVYETAASAVGVPGQYMVAVAWQGLNSTAAPTVACGSGQYGNEAMRRVVTLPVFVGVLN